MHLCHVTNSHIAHTVLHASLESYLGAKSPFILLLLLLIFWLVFTGYRADHLFSYIVLSFVATSLPSRIWWLVTRSIKARIDAVTLQWCNFKVDSSKFDDVSDSYHLLLIVWKEVFEDLINRSFLTDDQPHRPIQVDIVLLVLVCLSLCLRLLIDRFDDAMSIRIWLFTKVSLV